MSDTPENAADTASTLPVLVGYLETDGRYRWGSEAYRAWFGIDPQTLAGRYVGDVLGPEAFARRRGFLNEALGGKQVRYEAPLPDARGQARVCETLYVPDKGDDLVRGLFVIAQDVTNRSLQADELRAEIAARTRSEARFRTLAEAMPQIVWATAPEGSHFYFNRGWYEYTGQTEAQSLDNGFADALHPEDEVRAAVAWQAAQDEQSAYEIEYRLRGRDGAYRWFVDRAAPVRDETGQVALWVGTCTDVDDLKRLTHDADAREATLRLALEEAAGLGAWECDLATGRISGSPLCFALFGRTKEQMPDLAAWGEAVHPDDRARVYASWQSFVAGDEAARIIEYCALWPDKQTVCWLSVRGTLLPGKDGTPSRAVGVMSDITARHAEDIARLRSEAERETLLASQKRLVGELQETAAALRASEEQMRFATEAANVGTFNYDWRTNVLTWDARARALFEVGAEETVTSATFFALLHPDDRDRLSELAALALDPSGDGSYITEYRVVLGKEGGRTRWIATRGQVQFHADGTPARFDGTLADITKQKRVQTREQFLASLSERLRFHALHPDALLQHTLEIIGPFLQAGHAFFADVDGEAGTMTVRREWAVRPDGLLSLAEKTFFLSDWGAVVAPLRTGETVGVSEATHPGARLLPYPPGMSRAVLLVPQKRQNRWEGVFGIADEHARIWTADEVRLLEEATALAWLALDNARLYQTMRDELAERKRAEAERDQAEAQTRAEERRYRALVRALTQIVWVTNPEGRMTGDLSEWCAFTGATPEQVRNRTARSVHPDDVDKTNVAWQRAIETQTSYQIEHRIRRHDGVYLLMLARAVPVFDDDGNLKEWVGVHTDITEQREAERVVTARAERQGHIAESLQRSLLLVPPPDAYPGIVVKPLYQSAEDDALVGGDFFDVFALSENRVALVVGDGTGKGVEAATYTAEVKFALRAFLREHADLPTAMSLLNDFVADNDRLDAAHLGGSYVALVVAVVNTKTGEAVCAGAGAEPPLIVRAQGAGGLPVYEAVDTGGPLLGVEHGAVYETARVTLGTGDLIALTTDGLTEARRPRTRQASPRAVRPFFGSSGVGESLADALQNGLSLSETAQETVDRARRFAGGAINDDVCLLLARRQFAE